MLVRGIGQLKQRFCVVHGEIRLELSLKASTVVDVCALPHSVCKNMNIRVPPEDHAAADDDNEVEDDVAPNGNGNLSAPHVPG